MKTGDIVSVYDGSYSLRLLKGEMKPSNGYLLNGHRFCVLATGGKYPTNTSSASGVNDALLIDVNDPDFVLFTQVRFCRVLTPAPTATMEVAIPRGTKRVVLDVQ